MLAITEIRYVQHTCFLPSALNHGLNKHSTVTYVVSVKYRRSESLLRLVLITEVNGVKLTSI